MADLYISSEKRYAPADRHCSTSASQSATLSSAPLGLCGKFTITACVVGRISFFRSLTCTDRHLLLGLLQCECMYTQWVAACFFQ